MPSGAKSTLPTAPVTAYTTASTVATTSFATQPPAPPAYIPSFISAAASSAAPQKISSVPTTCSAVSSKTVTAAVSPATAAEILH